MLTIDLTFFVVTLNSSKPKKMSPGYTRSTKVESVDTDVTTQVSAWHVKVSPTTPGGTGIVLIFAVMSGDEGGEGGGEVGMYSLVGSKCKLFRALTTGLGEGDSGGDGSGDRGGGSCAIMLGFIESVTVASRASTAESRWSDCVAESSDNDE